jgi:molybdenum cofactor guanylyltransferase
LPGTPHGWDEDAGVKILGAILAGGQSRRFGSDKALALVEGKPLLAHVADTLRPQCVQLVVAGRVWPGIESVIDLPAPGLGPLGGLAGALALAQRDGFDAVLSSGCDVLGLPVNLVTHLGTGPAILEDLPIVGLWPTALAAPLAEWLTAPANRSVYRFAEKVGARQVPMPPGLINANYPDDLG